MLSATLGLTNGTDICSLPSSFYTIVGSVSVWKERGMLLLVVLPGCELKCSNWKHNTVVSDQLFLHHHHARGIIGCRKGSTVKSILCPTESQPVKPLAVIAQIHQQLYLSFQFAQGSFQGLANYL